MSTRTVCHLNVYSRYSGQNVMNELNPLEDGIVDVE